MRNLKQPSADTAIDTSQPEAARYNAALGAHWDGNGVSFALLAPNASQVWLCLFEHADQAETRRLPLLRQPDGVWRGYLPAAAPGLLYGYRVAGTWAPQHGQWFNPNKLLLDPYAREVVGHCHGQPEFSANRPGDLTQPCPLDNAAIALKARVVNPAYDWQGDVAPRIPVADTVIYECHVKGFTRLWPDMPPGLCGSYAALAQTPVLDYLQQLGITSLCLLPVHPHADEVRLHQLGLSNYWGYNTVAFFALEASYASRRPDSNAALELRDAIKALHARGIEVLLDVVYNHSAEGNTDGPTLCWRGIDNTLYYQLRPDVISGAAQASDISAQYLNYTGCGNTFNLNQPQVMQMVLDSLRYWVSEFHVDGFRFDLAPVLGRDASGFRPDAPLLQAIAQDPLLSQVKLIAEPWDIGPGGYQLGQFPDGWLEWNDQYRDTMRAFWLHQWPTLGQFARRFAASSDLFQHDQRQPTASINFICAHDGFTLADALCYNHKHNAANGEHNRDGHNHNHSWNGGVEGPCADPALTQLRQRLQRALLATLLFSQGTPMLLAGDEIGHSQGGNNNAYCQDNATTWLNWAQADQPLHHWVQRLLAIRRRYCALRKPHWYNSNDVNWRHPNGQPMQPSDWDSQDNYSIAIHLHDLPTGEDCLLLCNAEARDIEFLMPDGHWNILLDSGLAASSTTVPEPAATAPGRLIVAGRSLLLAVKILSANHDNPA
ncbi:MAG: glycogen debranching protein GlgX [Pseudomonadota bacterium]|jgi:glycogen operon protein